MIPRKIHQTAKTAEIPQEWRDFQDQVRRLHPGWEYKLWTDADNRALVAESAPQWLALYDALPRPIMRVDMIRYIILDLVGGMYLDLDYEMFRAFDLLNEKIVLPRESDPGADVVLGNCILASEPGHPFWQLALTELEKSFSGLGRRPGEEDVIWLTGPGLLTRTYSRYARSDESILIPRRDSFHPKTPRTQDEYAAVTRIAGVYGVHHCAGSWRAKTLTQRLTRKLSVVRARLSQGPRENPAEGESR